MLRKELVSSGHPVLKCSSLERGVQLECGRGRETIHFNADSSSPELLVRTTVAVNQLTHFHSVSTQYDQVQKKQSRLDFRS